MNHFFARRSQASEDFRTVLFDGQDYKHIVQVLRLREGEELSVTFSEDPAHEYRYGVEEITKENVRCTLRFVKENDVELPVKITLYQALPKGDKMDTVIQKAVELGAYAVRPVQTKRCIMKLSGERAETRIRRWQSIAEAAAKQSKRAIVPEVRMPLPMEEALKEAADADVKLIPYELAESEGENGMERTRLLIESIAPGDEVAVFIGPEGGFELHEIEAAVAAGFRPVTLGRRILRTETAGPTVLSWLVYALEP